MKYIHLRKFNKEELIFDNKETVIILKFIFRNKHALIDGLEINDRIREFSQGLLLEAIDASYALGFVAALFGGVFNPGAGAKKILMKFGRKASKHWFKHATAKDLLSIKIYDTVRQALEVGFTSKLGMYANGTAMNETKNSGFVVYAKTKQKNMVWG